MVTAPGAALQQTEVIVVDPNITDYAELTYGPHAEGYAFRFFTSGEDAARIAPRSGRTLWLINVDLPDMTGFELAAWVRARCHKAAVYLIGDQYRADDEVHCRAEGALYACKPANPNWLPHAQPRFAEVALAEDIRGVAI